MLKAGRIQTLTVSRVSEYGLYLADEEQNEVLLPNRYTSLTDKVGDRKEVFLYHDSEDRLVATTRAASWPDTATSSTSTKTTSRAAAWPRPNSRVS